MKITCEKKLEINSDVSQIVNKDNHLCVVDWSKKMFDYARSESCGKCVMCREGTMQIYKIIKDITEGKGESEDIGLLKELAEVIKENGGCELSRLSSENLLVAIESHTDEWESHIKRKRCSALVCKKYISIHILPEKCQGCNKCMDSCSEEAIAGSKGMIHVIDQEKCSRCGKCIAICESNAIEKAGAIKPKTPESPIPVGSWQSGTRRRRRG